MRWSDTGIPDRSGLTEYYPVSDKQIILKNLSQGSENMPEYLRLGKFFSNVSAIADYYHQVKKVKYCIRCGAKFKHGTDLICPVCGAKDPDQAQKLRHEWIAFFKHILKFLLMIALAIIVGLTYQCYQFVEEVKTSCPDAYPDITMEQAFDAFFADPKWSFGEMEGSYVTVNFTGTCLYREKEVKAHLIIYNYVNENKNTVKSLDFNGVPQQEEILQLLLNTVYQSYTDE